MMDTETVKLYSTLCMINAQLPSFALVCLSTTGPATTPLHPRPIDTTGPSRLLKLPLEVQSRILDHLDIRDVAQLGKVSTRARELVSFATRRISRVPGLAGGLVKYGLIDQFTLCQIEQFFRPGPCTLCKKLGVYICLVTAQRFCRECLTRPGGYPIDVLSCPAT